jgi:hypothetical protein
VPGSIFLALFYSFGAAALSKVFKARPSLGHKLFWYESLCKAGLDESDCFASAARFSVSPTMPRCRASPDPVKSPMTTNPVAMPMRVGSNSQESCGSHFRATVFRRTLKTQGNKQR